MGDDVPLVTACVAALLLTPILGAIGSRLGLVDRPGRLKIHDRAIPVTGGVGVAVATALGMAVAGGTDTWILASVVVALAGGLIDDVRPTAPWVRLLVQASAGALLVAGGLELEPLGALGRAGLVLATVACCNGVNMLDGQDGLAAGVGVIAALGMALVLGSVGATTTLPLATAGALLGFVAWNRPPARVFLGDSGAYATGVLLAAAAAQVATAGAHGLLAAGACLGVVAYELVATVVRRVASAAPAAMGDRRHSYDLLATRLGSRLRSTGVVWALGVLCSLSGLVVIRSGAGGGVALIAILTGLAASLDIRVNRSQAKEGR